MVKLNLNSKVKFKLTPIGAEIYYNQFEYINKILLQKGLKPFEKKMPNVDKNGFTEMQLHQFIDLYGRHIGVGKPNVIDDISLYIDEKELKKVGEE